MKRYPVLFRVSVILAISGNTSDRSGSVDEASGESVKFGHGIANMYVVMFREVVLWQFSTTENDGAVVLGHLQCDMIEPSLVRSGIGHGGREPEQSGLVFMYGVFDSVNGQVRSEVDISEPGVSEYASDHKRGQHIRITCWSPAGGDRAVELIGYFFGVCVRVFW